MRKPIAALIAAALLVGCGASVEGRKPVLVQFRLAQAEAGPGFEEPMTFEGGGVFYLSDQVALDSRNVLTSELSKGQLGFEVAVSFDEAGTDVLARLTSANVGKHVAILVDGELVSAPRIAAPIVQGMAVINGNFDETEAKRIAEGILLR